MRTHSGDSLTRFQAARYWIILAPFNCTAHGRVSQYQLPKMDAELLEFVASLFPEFSVVQLRWVLFVALKHGFTG
jgi:hypothetical protein